MKLRKPRRPTNPNPDPTNQIHRPIYPSLSTTMHTYGHLSTPVDTSPCQTMPFHAYANHAFPHIRTHVHLSMPNHAFPHICKSSCLSTHMHACTPLHAKPCLQCICTPVLTLSRKMCTAIPGRPSSSTDAGRRLVSQTCPSNVCLMWLAMLVP